MSSVSSPGFLQASGAHVSCDSWEISEDGELHPLADALPYWDCATDLAVSREVTVNVQGARSDCGFAEEADVQLRLAATWRCGSNPLRRCFCTRDIPNGTDETSLALEGTIPGSELADQVTLETLLVLASASSTPVLAASRAGSILWRDEKDVLLAGMASRFPIEIVDFEAVSLRSEAGWCLDWNSDDLALPLRQVVRLRVNRKHPRVATAATRPSASPENQAISSAIYYDVGRSLICGALRSREFLHRFSSYEYGTVGHVVSQLLRRCFPGQDPASIHTQMEEDTDEFHSSIQATLAVFGD